MRLHLNYTFLLLLSIPVLGTAQSEEAIILNSVAKMKALKTVQFEMTSVERIEGKYLTSKSKVKTQFWPYKVYIQSIKEGEERGPEVLYHAPDETALISPNKFPFINIPAKPNSFILRNGHHHTLEQNVFTFLASVMENEIQKIGQHNLSTILKSTTDTTYNGKECHKVRVVWPNYGWEKYQVKEGETISSIAQRLVVSDYHILQKNTQYDDYDDPKPGETLFIPKHYAHSVVFLIDKELLLPIVIRIKDENGLFAMYSFTNLKVNPKLTALDFSRDNDAYNFKY